MLIYLITDSSVSLMKMQLRHQPLQLMKVTEIPLRLNHTFLSQTMTCLMLTMWTMATIRATVALNLAVGATPLQHSDAMQGKEET